ncbi:hypothetical protein NL676_016176 [Syzygium grande]|nr:hypothetical protein NL676_016176 [Syzygium grande]
MHSDERRGDEASLGAAQRDPIGLVWHALRAQEGQPGEAGEAATREAEGRLPSSLPPDSKPDRRREKGLT